MKIGFLFPGQGAQSAGMGNDLYENYECYREIYNRVKEITNIDVAEITFNEQDERLNQTKYTQLCVLTMSLGILEILKENGIKAEISAGLSLGEYTSLIYSNVLGFDDGIHIVKKRGELMQELAPNGDWAMAAILGLDDSKVEQACKMVDGGFVVPVNYNCTGQVVISGEAKAVEEAGAKAKEIGAKKVRILNTSGPFHTEKLLDSANALKNELKSVQFNKCNSKVVKNLDGKLYKDGDDYSEILMKHIISPVLFAKSLQTMLDEGVDTFIEKGPGKTLSGFVKRMETDKEINILNINDVDSLIKTINFVKEA